MQLQTAAPISATSGFASAGNNFDDFKLGTLSGTQFEDLTGNGFGVDDPALSNTKQGVTVNLFLNGGSTPLASTSTAPSGSTAAISRAPRRSCACVLIM